MRPVWMTFIGGITLKIDNDLSGAVPTNTREDERKDYFVYKDGEAYAGLHLLIELWECKNLNNPETIDKVLRDAALAAGATILHSHMHHFSPSGGVSGVVVLAESHISIHTWPERDYAAIDIFMCGDCNPHDAIPTIQAGLRPGQLDVSEHKRGKITP